MCPKSLTGVHVPVSADSSRCKLCGQEIPGAAEKLEGMAAAIRGAYTSLPEWEAAFRAMGALLAARGQTFTSEDITERVGFYREPGTNRNNAVGALMSGMAKEGLIRRVGRAASKLPRQHGAEISVWRGN